MPPRPSPRPPPRPPLARAQPAAGAPAATSPLIPRELIELSRRHAPTSGTVVTALPSLQIIRSDVTHTRVHSVLRPSLCFLAQGAKEVTLGNELLRYQGGEFLFASVDLPVTGEVIEATARQPYLCLALEIDPGLVFELASASATHWPTAPAAAATRRAIFVGQSDAMMSHAFLRLLACLDRPLDIEVLAPLILREITYRLLLGPYGAAVRELVLVGSQTQRVAKAIERLKREYASPLRVEELARTAGMSASSFHEHFKKVTALSPLQYQKQLRLQEARRLLLGDGGGAGDVGFRVGYESASQFSREYARFFGLPPASDVKRQRQLAS